jgi:adenylate cyclase
MERRKPKRWSLTRRQRRLGQAALVGLAVAAVISLAQWAGLFASMRLGAVDYLYETDGDPGDDIVIVAIDEKSLQALGAWPWTFAPYVGLFERLKGASVVGFDVLLSDPGPVGYPDTPALLEATRQAGNVVLPLSALEIFAPEPQGELLYSARQPVRPFPALIEAAASAGSIKVVLDRDGTLRRVPLLVDAGGGETWEAFSLQVLRLHLDLGDAPASLVGDRVVIGDETEIKYEVPTDINATMFVNFVGATNTFSSTNTYYPFIDVIEGQVPASAFEDKVVLVGMMNSLDEMDLHRAPVSAGRMAGIEFQANVIHTLLHHRPLVRTSEVETTVTVVLLALVSAMVLSQLGAVPGAVFTAVLALGYFVYTGIRFDAGRLPEVLLPYATMFINYAAVMTTRFASERGERRQVTSVFGRFVSAEVRDAIVSMALEDPDLVQPGGRQMEISVLFADIRGFTTISENLLPSEVVEILNQYLDSMEEEVFKQGGTLDKYTGDGMMVLFGAPLEQPDHAERAVRAALGMQRAAAEVSRQRDDARWKIAYGIGVTTGPAVVGHIGSKRRLDYTAIGDTVNLASRLEGKAPPGVILINQAAYEAVKDIAVVEELGPMMVKGRAKPVVVYRVLGLQEDE